MSRIGAKRQRKNLAVSRGNWTSNKINAGGILKSWGNSWTECRPEFFPQHFSFKFPPPVNRNKVQMRKKKEEFKLNLGIQVQNKNLQIIFFDFFGMLSGQEFKNTRKTTKNFHKKIRPKSRIIITHRFQR